MADLTVEECIAKLRVPIGGGRTYYPGHPDIVANYAADHLARLQAENAKLREALAPFARHGRFVNTDFRDDPDDTIAAGLRDQYITLGDFRRAAAAYGETDGT